MNEETLQGMRSNDLTEWEKKFEKTGKTNSQLVGELISGGAEMINYTSSIEGERWRPSVYTAQGRKMITITETGPVTGPRWGLETFSVGLDHATEIRGSRSQGADGLVMVPYLRFTPHGEIDAIKTEVLVFSDRQRIHLRGVMSGQLKK